MWSKLLSTISLGCFTLMLSAQTNGPILIDEVLAVVGKNAIFKSDVDEMVRQMQMQGAPLNNSTDCYALGEKLFEKLLVHKAEVDSVEVSDQEIDDAIDRRMQYMLMRLGGSEDEFLKYYGKTVLQFKKEVRGQVADNLLGQKVQAKITQTVTISPKEVTEYFNNLSKDSLPVVPESYKMAQLVVKAKASAEEKTRTRIKLEGIRRRILNGSDFELQAQIHSKDPGSRDRGGDLGYLSRTQLVPEFSAVAFRLEPGEVSDIVETQFGFHIIQLLEKKGNLIHARHILLTPDIYSYDMELAKKRADSIAEVIRTGVNFNKLASDLSDDEPSKANGGIVRNPNTGGDYFEVEDMNQELYLTMQQMQEGEITPAQVFVLQDGTRAYRILYLMDKLEFHTADIKTDYDRIKSAALKEKQSKAVANWINGQVAGVYLKLPKTYKNCADLSVWYMNETKPFAKK